MSIKFFLIIIGICINIITLPIFDNRFVPLRRSSQIFIEGLPSSFRADCFVATANRAFDKDDDDTIGIPEIFGRFDLNTLATAIEKTGKPNPLRSDLRGRRLPFRVDGRIQAQGLSFCYDQSIFDFLSCGASWIFMRVNSRQLFFLDTKEMSILTVGDKNEIERARRRAFDTIGLENNHNAQLGFGDIDAYLRLNGTWDYKLKCRRINAGFSIGALLATGLNREFFSASSIPFGGNGHWGFYVSGDALFELKENIKTGLLFRINKRFARTKNDRISVEGEPYIFGALVDKVRVNPGPTIIFSPYLILENLRKGFGFGVYYTMTVHMEDDWFDRRVNKNIPIKLSKAVDTSDWGSDYFTIYLFYDFGKVKVKRSFDPIISFKWDVPSMLFISSRVPKTHKVSLGVEFVF